MRISVFKRLRNRAGSGRWGFDSLGGVPIHPHVVQHPVMKDDPDMNVGSQNGTRYGISDLVLNGGLGGRLDHSVANLQILTFLAGQGARAF